MCAYMCMICVHMLYYICDVYCIYVIFVMSISQYILLYIYNLYAYHTTLSIYVCIEADLSYPSLYPSSTIQHPPNGRPSRPVSGVGPSGQNYDRPSSVSKGSSFPTNGSYLAGSEIIHISLEDEEGKV